jgi:hypothetical protein
MTKEEFGMHVMIDLETMGTGPNAAIVAIGACIFDANGIGDRFYDAVDLQSCIDAGLTVDGQTVMWWLDQSDEVRGALKNSSPLHVALERFSDFMADSMGNISGVWGCGAAFDNVILRNAYKAAGLECPWPFWADRCFRTVRDTNEIDAPDRAGTHHNALDDAVHQANYLIKIWNTKEQET